MVLSEIHAQGFDPDNFFSAFVQGGSPMRRLLEAVEAGEGDVAFARACTWEELVAEDPEFTKKFRPVGLKTDSASLACAHSTALFPNWTIVSTSRALQKPVESERLLTAIATVVQEDLDRRACPIDEAVWRANFEALTARERTVITEVATGRLNREIASRLGISDRTVHIHRQAAYKKLGVHNVAELAPLTVLIERGKI